MNFISKIAIILFGFYFLIGPCGASTLCKAFTDISWNYDGELSETEKSGNEESDNTVKDYFEVEMIPHVQDQKDICPLVLVSNKSICNHLSVDILKGYLFLHYTPPNVVTLSFVTHH